MNCLLYPVQLFLCTSDGWPDDCLLFLVITASAEASWGKLWQLLKVWSVGSCVHFCSLNPGLSSFSLGARSSGQAGMIVTVCRLQFVDSQGVDETCLCRFLQVSVCSTTRYVVFELP